MIFDFELQLDFSKCVQQTVDNFKLIIFAIFLLPQNLLANTYHFNYNQEASIIGFGIGLEITGLYADSKKSQPNQANFDSLDKDNINSVDRFVTGRWNQSAVNRSDLLLYSSMTIPLILPVLHRSDFWDISLLYFETQLVTNGGVTLAKGMSNRYRPYAYDSSVPENTLNDTDTKRSFFSGHAAHIASSSIFFLKVYSDLNPKSQYIESIWAGSGLMIFLGSWQRLESGKHFPSDILTGVVWGSLVGYAIPEWHRQRRKLTILPFNRNNDLGIQFLMKY